MSQDINGQPASEYDGSRISTDIREQLAKLGPEKAARVRKVADAPVTPPQSWEQHIAAVRARR